MPLALALVATALALAPAVPAAALPPLPTGVSIRQSSPDAVSDTAPVHAADPALRLVSPMVPWRALEPQDDVFDLAQMDLNVADAAANDYKLIVRIMAGRWAPAWLLASGGSLALLGTDQNATDYCDWIDVLPPWSATLEAEYREMLSAVGDWLAQPDGLGGTKGDHVYLVPISMPTLLGSEMQIGFGANVSCPVGTDGAGLQLSATNAAAWHTLGDDEQLRSWTEDAWRRAIGVHMEELPPNVRTVIAYGALFGDGQAAALRIAQSEVGPNRARLWSMYTNLQPQVSGAGQVTGVWKDWCRACHDVIWAALEAGGTAGFQVASTDRMDTHAEFAAAVDDALGRYAPRFLEVNDGALAREGEYLLTGADPVQARLAAIAGQVLSAVDLTCETVAIGSPSTCTATVNELWDDPSIVPTGDVAFAAGAAVSPAVCTLDANASCAVTVTPSGPGPVTVDATYAGDPDHLPAAAAGSVATFARSTSASLACEGPVEVGVPVVCTVTVTDTDAGEPSAPTGTVGIAATGAGSLDAASCTLGGTGPATSCTIGFTPSAAGTSTIVADYAGTGLHAAAAAQAEVVAGLRTSLTSVTCAPASLPAGATTTCTATVGDAGGTGATGPVGTITWSVVGDGALGATSCSLSGAGTTRSCAVVYTPSTPDASTVTATYGGSGVHAGGSAAAGVTATPRDTSTSVSCVPSTLLVGGPSTCTATVTDTDGAGGSGPTGAVTWSTVATGSFGATTCVLGGSGTATTCSVVYTPLTSGSHGVAAAYGGDGLHGGSGGTATITASPVDTTAPTVRITSPKANGTVPKGKTTTIAATATDAGGVARVEFRVNGALVCTDTTSPYTCAWAVAKVVATYTITVTAVDAAGNPATATITVRSK